MIVAVLGPGGVGGFVAGALARAGTTTTVVAREDTAAVIARDGLQVQSARLGPFTVHPPAVAALGTAVDVLVVAVKAPALDAALGRVTAEPGLVVPLLNGLEHVARLRERFGAERVAAATIRVGAQREAPGHVVQGSAFLRIDLAPATAQVGTFAHVLRAAEVPTAVHDDETAVLWSKLCRLNALALTTAASGLPIGGVRAHPRWRLLLEGAVDETVAVANAEGAAIDAHAVLGELVELPDGASSSLALDVAAGGPTELDAIGGAVLRAAGRHGLPAPSVETLVEGVEERLRSTQA